MRVDLRLQGMKLGVLLADGGDFDPFNKLLNPPDHPVEGRDQNVDLLVRGYAQRAPKIPDLHLLHFADQLLERRRYGPGDHGGDQRGHNNQNGEDDENITLHLHKLHVEIPVRRDADNP
ncbi:hypothetical protein D3C73_1135620 [compost metagenome]